MNVTITIKVNYDETTVDSNDEILMLLEHEVDRHVGDGMLTPTGDEVVNTYAIEIE